MTDVVEVQNVICNQFFIRKGRSHRTCTGKNISHCIDSLALRSNRALYKIKQLILVAEIASVIYLRSLDILLDNAI